MSSKTIHEKLVEAYKKLPEVIKLDTQTGGCDVVSSYRLINEYLKLYTTFEDAYDQIQPPQQRGTVKKAYVSVVNRLLELFQNHQKNYKENFSKICLTLMEKNQKIRFDIPIPRSVKDEQGQDYLTREDLIKKSFQQFEEARLANEMSAAPAMSVEDAIQIIQKVERSRKSRHETLIKQEIIKQREILERQNKVPDKEKSAVVIKRFWSTYGLRFKDKQKKEEEYQLIGMKPIPQPSSKQLVADNEKKRKESQQTRKAELKKFEDVTKEYLDDHKSRPIQREMEELSANFVNETKKTTGKLPNVKPKTKVIPLVTNGKEVSDNVQSMLDYLVAADPKNKNKKEEPKQAKQPAPSGSGKKGEIVVVKSGQLDAIQNALEEFNEVWASNENFANDHSDELSVELVRKEIWAQMLPSVATGVEFKLKSELKNLKILEMRRVKKAKPPKEKKKRTKKVRDPLGGKTDEEVLSELVGLGIAKSVPQTTYDDFVGEWNITKTIDANQPELNGNPSYAAIKNECITTIVMPFAANRDSPQPFIPKGVMIQGPKGSGKTTLVEASVNAMGATFLNFSPHVLVGKETPTPRILVLMLLKIARVLAPSVILVESVELMYGPRKKADASKKFKAQLKRNVKKLKPRERVLLMGTTSEKNVPKACAPMFTHTILLYKPDFPTRVDIWRHWLNNTKVVIADGSVNALAFATENYPAGSIVRAIKKAQKISQSRVEPEGAIKVNEMVDILSNTPIDEINSVL